MDLFTGSANHAQRQLGLAAEANQAEQLVAMDENGLPNIEFSKKMIKEGNYQCGMCPSSTHVLYCGNK